jgi:hypothetical protein
MRAMPIVMVLGRKKVSCRRLSAKPNDTPGHPNGFSRAGLGRRVRILVTGPLNPVGRAVVMALAQQGHEVRAFGVEAGLDPFHGVANVECFPGWCHVGGSIEPVASEARALIHCAPMDAPGEDKAAHALSVERGTLYARYTAERELVGAFVVALPANPGRAWGKVVGQARAHVEGTRKLVPTLVVESGGDAKPVLDAFAQLAAHMPASVQI